MNKDKINFLTIGDIVIDAFIRLKDAHVHCKIDNDACELCLRFGDKVPYESVIVIPAVGNSPNAAVSASRLGLRSAIITNIGEDRYGTECLNSLKNDKVITDYIAIEKNKNTNHHYVLWYDIDRTILIKHTEFTYKLPKFEKVSWIYLSSLAENSLEYHQEIIQYLKDNPETKLAFQPGTFQIKLGTEKLKEIYARTEIFFCNVEEARLILKGDASPREELAKKISALGPRIAVVTDGPRGAFAYDGTDTWFMPPYPDPQPPFERTGAGDAFSSTFTAALALGKTVPEALRYAPINSMSVVQKVGAQEGLLSRDNLEEFLKNAPAEYVVKKVG